METSRLGQLVHDRRQQLGLSLDALASLSGIHKSLLSRIETGAVERPGHGTLDRLAYGLQLSLTDLYGSLGAGARQELPPLQPYLRAKYGLTDDAISAVTNYLQRYGELQPGPEGGEDER